MAAAPPAPPSYAETTAKRPTHINLNDSIARQIAQVQRERVHTLIETHVAGLLLEHIQSGLSSMVYALIPSDSLLQQGSPEEHQVLEKGRLAPSPTASKEEIVSFSSSDFVRVVRLQSPENQSRFWKQAKVIQELEGEVRVLLGLDRQTPMELPETSRGYLDRPIGWQSNQFSHLRPGEIGVRVTMEEMSIRKENGMGLFETRTGPAVVIRVAVG